MQRTGCTKTACRSKQDCVYSNDEEARKCVKGELSFFNPTRWGNEQLSLFVVTQYCDTNYNITYNNAGIVCVFTNKRVQKPASGSESSVSGSVPAKYASVRTPAQNHTPFENKNAV